MNLTDAQLKEISDLASQQHAIEQEIATLEEALEQKKTRLNQLSGTLIPEAMMAVGMESFKLADGTMVKVDKFYAGRIDDSKAAEAFAWLRKTGNDSLIKREVKLMFGKGEDGNADAAIAALRLKGFEPADKQSVHPMTLKSFIREQFESGSDFPAELFGAYVGNKTKIVPAKKTVAAPSQDPL